MSLEKALFSGNLEVKDLSTAWNDKMKEYLGIIPLDDATGVLQDCHWYSGLFGYFPSYTLGNIYSGQFLSQIEKELGPVDYLIESDKLGRYKQLVKSKCASIWSYEVAY